MGPNYSGSHLLSPLLNRMGLFRRAPSGGEATTDRTDASGARIASKARRDMLSTLRHMVPKSFRAAVSRTLLPRQLNEKLNLRWMMSGITWEQTRVFLIENANEGYLRINLKGREPLGIVEPGKEYEDLCEEIYQTAKGMINPANNRRAALTVYKADNIFSGPCRSHMPDIIINWDEKTRVTTELLTDKYGLVRSAHPAYGYGPYYTGNHRPNAFVVAVGPDILSGTVLEGASILDLAPTTLSHFGINPPAYMDGEVLSILGGRGAV